MKKAYISNLAEVSIVVVLACKVFHKQVSYGNIHLEVGEERSHFR